MVKFWDRYRWLVTIGAIGILCWSLWYAYATWQAVTNCDDDLFSVVKLNQTWMLVALLIGINIGLSCAGLMSYLVKSIVGGYRAERLLLKLHAEQENSNKEVIEK